MRITLPKRMDVILKSKSDRESSKKFMLLVLMSFESAKQSLLDRVPARDRDRNEENDLNQLLHYLFRAQVIQQSKESFVRLFLDVVEGHTSFRTVFFAPFDID